MIILYAVPISPWPMLRKNTLKIITVDFIKLYFQNSRPSIIKDENLVNPELLEISATESERSGLLRANDKPPADGRPVIHTDSD